MYGSAGANSKVLTGKWCAYPAPACWGEVPAADGIHIREGEQGGGERENKEEGGEGHHEIEPYGDKLHTLLLYSS